MVRIVAERRWTARSPRKIYWLQTGKRNAMKALPGCGLRRKGRPNFGLIIPRCGRGPLAPGLPKAVESELTVPRGGRPRKGRPDTARARPHRCRTRDRGRPALHGGSFVPVPPENACRQVRTPGQQTPGVTVMMRNLLSKWLAPGKRRTRQGRGASPAACSRRHVPLLEGLENRIAPT